MSQNSQQPGLNAGGIHWNTVLVTGYTDRLKLPDTGIGCLALPANYLNV
jgi:hypothetical protein